MATYNGAKYLREQIDSILVQLGADDELIVSDDGSTDETCAIIASYTDPRIRLLHNIVHDCKWNFVYAMQYTRGEVIFLADQDDVWLPGKYTACLKALEDSDLVVTDSIITDENLQTIYPSFFKVNRSGKGILRNAIRTSYWGACMAFRKTVFEAALPFPQTNAFGHDNWLGMVAEITGKVCFIDEPYLLYRRHIGVLSNPLGGFLHRSKRSIFVKVWDRVKVMYIILKYQMTYAR